ncbi:hypothetical protein [uncultured Amnibacterium sp.]|uniref:hypothetical protein n=1 Tax=uncultured Amnibacterium sp. TaxID=1631851 RepID=UPI0035CC4B42
MTANNADVTAQLPDIAKQSLALAEKVKDDPAASPKPIPTPSGATKDEPVALGTMRQIGDYSVVVNSFTARADGSEQADWTVTYTGETQGDTGFINLWFIGSDGPLGDQGCTGAKPETQPLEPNVAVARQSCAPMNGGTFTNSVFVFTPHQPENYWAQQ